MTRRRVKRKAKLARLATALGDEPPDPASALIIGTSIGLTAMGAQAITSGVKAHNEKKRMQVLGKPKPSPVAGTSTELKPGEKVNLINTTPQGVLEDPTLGRKTILGG